MHQKLFCNCYSLAIKFCLILSLTLTVLNSSHSVHAESQKIKWTKLTEDLEYTSYNPNADAIISQEMLFFRTSLKKYKPKIITSSDLKPNNVKNFCNEANAIICINANFFDENSSPLGLIIKNNKTLNNLHIGGTLLNGVVAFNDKTIKISPRKNFKQVNIENAIQSGPLLLMAGKQYARFKSPEKESRRSGVCVDKSDRLIIFSSAGEFNGPSLAQLTSILLKPEINCKDALNFDGGGSAQLYVNTKKIGAAFPRKDHILGQDYVPVAFGLSVK